MDPQPSDPSDSFREANASPISAWIQASNSDPYAQYLDLFARTSDVSRQPGKSIQNSHTLKIAPLFSGAVHSAVESPFKFGEDKYSQYGLLGMISDDEQYVNESSGFLPNPTSNLLFSNTEEPWSAFICGSQGSGKSHTLSCLLENTLLPDPNIGALKTPLTGLVFHYDKFSNFGNGQVCEATYLCSALRGGIRVRVLVAPTSLNRMARQYHNLPGLPEGCEKPRVLPLYFSQEQLSVETMMTLMAVNDTGVSAPLYICAIRQILREIAMENQDKPGFDYMSFRHRLACMELVQSQSTPLQMRLELLQSVLLEAKQTAEAQAAYQEIWTFQPQTLTIIDLSDQFVNEADACALFSICLRLFMADWQSNPRIIALDEAHKFLTASAEATKLTDDLIAVIRQQRHMSARVVVATQEPTVSNQLLDLCNVSIIHRFNSPHWYKTLRDHLAGACTEGCDKEMLFRKIVRLSTGEALVFCPTAVLRVESGEPVPLQDGHVKIIVRNRVSADGGRSIQASSQTDPRKAKPLPAIPQFQRLKPEQFPALGSLAKKNKQKFKVAYGNHTATAPVTTETTGWYPTSSQTVHGSLNASVGGQSPVTGGKRQKIGYNGTDSPQTPDLEFEAGSDDSSESPCPSNVEPRQTYILPIRQAHGAPPSKPSPQVVTSPKENILRDPNCGKRDILQLELEQAMYRTVKNLFPAKHVKDPCGYLIDWLKETGQDLGLPSNFLLDKKLNDGCKDATAMDMMKRVVKRYYDDRNIKQAERANYKWLRG